MKIIRAPSATECEICGEESDEIIIRPDEHGPGVTQHHRCLKHRNTRKNK